MQNLRFISGIVFGIALSLATVIFVSPALGQALASNEIAPFVINIQQSVPAETRIAAYDETGEAITMTVPLTVAVDLQVTVSGNQAVVTSEELVRDTVVTVGEYEEPMTIVDLTGYQATIRNADGVEIVQISTREILGKIWLEGILINSSDQVLNGVDLVTTYFDEGGNEIGFETGGMEFKDITPGTMSMFRVSEGLDQGTVYDEVATYEVVVKPKFRR